MRGVIAVALSVACTPKQPPPPPPPNIVGRPTPVAIDAAVAPVVEDAGAPVVADEPPPPEPVDASAIAVPDPIPPVKGPVTKIATGATVTITGIKITFKYSSHKSNGELGMWGFETVRFGAKNAFELRSEGSSFEAEIDANGAPLVFRHVDYNNFEIVLASVKAQKALDQEGCRAEIEKAAAARKLVIGDQSGTSEANGIVRFSTTGWVAYCGTLTRRIWFAPPPAERRRRR